MEKIAGSVKAKIISFICFICVLWILVLPQGCNKAVAKRETAGAAVKESSSCLKKECKAMPCKQQEGTCGFAECPDPDKETRDCSVKCCKKIYAEGKASGKNCNRESEACNPRKFCPGM
jgi:hypothetical protein